MTKQVEPVQAITDLIYSEAQFLDRRSWDEWLALYDEDCVYWVPAWKSDTELTSNPLSEVSLIYYDNRAGLEDRVYRLRTGSVASAIPFPRTAHIVGGVRVAARMDGQFDVAASWVCHWAWKKELNIYAGSYEYLIAAQGDRFSIRKKKTIVINGVIPRVLDFYLI